MDGRCDPVTQIATGAFHACALRTGGSVWCWGSNATGQLGSGAEGVGEGSTVPLRVPSIDDVSSLSAGYLHTCAVRRDGSVRCWGDNANGQLGNITLGVGGTSVAPVLVDGLSESTRVACGGRHACARTRAGAVLCWGANDLGQLGSDSALVGMSSATPLAVPLAGEIVAQVGSGGAHSCVRVLGTAGSAGDILCWGIADALGDGGALAVAHPTPVKLGSIDDAVDMDLGGSHTCVVRASGRAACWGLNVSGALGDGTTIRSFVPVPVGELTSATSVSASGGAFGNQQHSCAVNSDGAVRCWGHNAFGQLGDGTTMSPRTLPVETMSSEALVEVSSGALHSCARTGGGAVYCWGLSTDGQIGLGMTGTAVTVPALLTFP